jgi:DNA replication and repair protein RecF
VRVASVAADRIRSLTRVEVPLDPRLTAIVGPNGAGKTNLVEAVYFALTGRSFRTGDRRDMIPFGDSWARSRVKVEDGGGAERHEFLASISRDQGTRYNMDGAPVDRASALNNRPMVTVFSPDRLEIVKGPPTVRRAHLDTYVAARWPARAETRVRFGRALAQRNALIARINSGRGDASQLGPWDRQVSETGAALTRVRQEAVSELADPYARAAEDLGLEGRNQVVYRAAAVSEAAEFEQELARRLDADLKLGRTGWGPHHDEIRLELDGRQLRRFGSQGQQRLGLLSLLFAERDGLLAGGSTPPLMLLDDVMSELDGDRRKRLIERLLEGGQSVVTAAESDLIPSSDRFTELAIEDLVAEPEWGT